DAARRDKPLCPYTVLYWNFLDRHGSELGANPRTLFMMKHLERRSPEERSALRNRAEVMLADLDSL
ncbi:MAG: cryptochrome/photolyase family protein, partial [Caldimonas sp.]